MAKQLDDLKKVHDPATVIADLKQELKDARSQAHTAEAMREYVGTAKLAVNELQLPTWVFQPKSAKAPGVPKIMLSDLHWGEQVRSEQIGGVNSYNLAIARRRLQTVIETTIGLCKILDPSMSYPGLVMPLGGDMVSGNIHDELAASNELNTMPTVLDLYRQLVPAIRLMAETFGNVFLPHCVSGNHARDTKKRWSKDRNHTSFGWLLDQFPRCRFRRRQTSYLLYPRREAMLSTESTETRYLLTHGDQFRRRRWDYWASRPRDSRRTEKKNTRAMRQSGRITT